MGLNPAGVTNMKSNNHHGGQLLAFLGISLAFFVAASMLVAVAVPVFGIEAGRGTGLYVTQTVSQLVMFMLPVFIMVGMYYGDCRRSYLRAYFGGKAWLRALVGVAAVVLLVPLSDWLEVWNNSWSFGPLDKSLHAIQRETEAVTAEMLGGTSVGSLLVNLLVVALVPAVCEELFFRAGIQNLLQRWFTRGSSDGYNVGSVAAIVVTAVVFSILHGEVFSFMPRFAMGLMLGALYVYGGSIVVNTAAHFANNAIVVVLYWLVSRGVLDIDLDAPFRLPWLLTACCTLASVMLCWAFFGKDDKKMKISS